MSSAGSRLTKNKERIHKIMPKQITFRVYWQEFADVTVDLPDDIDINDKKALQEYAQKEWDSMPLPDNSEYLSNSDEIDEEHGFTITERE